MIRPKNAAYVWVIPARYPSPRLNHSLTWLDSQEHDHASGIYCHDHRELYLESRFWLRQILVAVTGVAPRALRLEPCRSGNAGPLRVANSGTQIVCDVSYTYSCIAVALSRGGDIGVDMERVWSAPLAADARYSALNWIENKFLHTVPLDERAKTALRLRVARQAYARASGTDAASLLERTQLSLVNGHHCVIEHTGAGGRSQKLSFSSLALKPGADGKEYALAVATTVKDLPLVLYRVPEQAQDAEGLAALPAQHVAPHAVGERLGEIQYRKSA